MKRLSMLICLTVLFTLLWTCLHLLSRENQTQSEASVMQRLGVILTSPSPTADRSEGQGWEDRKFGNFSPIWNGAWKSVL